MKANLATPSGDDVSFGRSSTSATPPATAGRVDRDRRRDLLIEVAATLAATNIDSVSMDGVAAAAGVSRPLVYKHFANRNDLLIAVYRREVKLLHETLARAVLTAPTLEEKFRALIGGALRAQADRGAALLALRAASGGSRELRGEQRRRDHQTVRYFTRIAVKSLGSDEKLSAMTITILLRSIEGVLAEWRLRPTAKHAARLEEAYVTVCMGALWQLTQQASDDAGEHSSRMQPEQGTRSSS